MSKTQAPTNLIMQVEASLNARFYERRDVIHGLFLGLVSRQHVVLLGPPGAAKTALAEAFAKVVGLSYWSTLLTRFSTPEELFGPLSLKALEQDAYRRIGDGRLPEAEVALIDEVFKGNSAILNTMLPVMNERVWFNDGQRLPLPLQLMIGASNEMPESEELNALWDRFALRFVVDYIQDPDSWDQWMTEMADPIHNGGQLIPMLDKNTIIQLQRAADQVDARPVIPTFRQLKNALAQTGIVLSDRRWAVAIRLVQAEAAIHGRTQATADDVRVVTATLWDQPDQRVDVGKLVLGIIAPHEIEALTIQDEMREMLRVVAEAPDNEKLKKAQEVSVDLKHLHTRTLLLIDQARKSGYTVSAMEELAKTIKERQLNILRDVLQIGGAI